MCSVGSVLTLEVDPLQSRNSRLLAPILGCHSLKSVEYIPPRFPPDSIGFVLLLNGSPGFRVLYELIAAIYSMSVNLKNTAKQY